MAEFWQGRGGQLLVAALVVGLAAVALAVLSPDRETGDLGGTTWYTSRSRFRMATSHCPPNRVLGSS